MIKTPAQSPCRDGRGLRFSGTCSHPQVSDLLIVAMPRRGLRVECVTLTKFRRIRLWAQGDEMMHQRRITTKTATALGAALGLIAALGPAATSARAQAAEDFREEFHQAYPLTANGRVEVSNVNGSVTISGGEANEVKVDAVKSANEARKLSECRIVVDAHSDSIRIETRYPEGQDRHHGNNAKVEYTIQVPRGARLDKVGTVNGGLRISGITGGIKASSVNGGAEAEEVSGSVDISSVNGNVEAVVASAGSDIELHTVNGSVKLTLPSDAQGEVSAKTVNGRIHDDFGLGVDKGHAGARMNGRLGSGNARIELNSVNGSIELLRANDGKPLNKATSESGDNSAPL